MANVAHHSTHRHRRRAAYGPLWAPLVVFAAAVLTAVAYIAYVLWPRWPDTPIAPDAPALPIMVAGVAFNIEPAAIRMAVQRHPGAQERIDLAYSWPALTPPDPAPQAAPDDSKRRLFVTIATGDGTLPLMARMQNIYPRYLATDASATPDGLTLRDFRSGTPYQGEELVFDAAAPEHFLARCSKQGVTNSGTCLLERRLGNADITLRFPRDWLNDWRGVAAGVDRLIARLHPGS